MGCNEARSRVDLETSQIIEEINGFFTKMKVRNFPIEKLCNKIVTTLSQTSDIQEWKKLLREELFNSDYNSTVNDLVNLAMDDAKNGHGDQLLPFLSLLFLSESTRENFINSFKALNLTKKTQNAGADVMNAIDNGLKVGIFAGIVSGFGALQNLKGAVNQVSNPNMINNYDLRNLILFYINFLTSLAVSSFERNNEIKKMKNYYLTVLKNAFDIGKQKKYVMEKFFNNYNNQDEINIEQFFTEHLNALKSDDKIRKELVESYIESLSREETKKIIFQK